MTTLTGQIFLAEISFKDGSREAKFILFKREKDFYRYMSSFTKNNPLYKGMIYYKDPLMNSDGSICTPNGNLFPNEVV